MDLKSPTPVGPAQLEGCPVSLPRTERQTIDDIKRDLSGLERFHGAIGKWVLLYGRSGCGKRRIATQAAEEIVASDGRKLLVVEAGTFESFVRDYYNLYFTLTGEKLHGGFDVALLLPKIKRTLEQRRHEWLLLLIEVSSFMESELNYPGQKMRTLIPDRGQVIMTSSKVVGAPVEANGIKAPRFICPLELASVSQLISVPELSLAESFEAESYHSCAGLLTNSMRRLHGPTSPTLVFMVVVAATLQVLNISSDTYVRVHRRRAGKRPPKDKFLARAASSFHIAMHILWEALADHDIWSTRLLAALSFTEFIGVPLDLLRALPVLNRTNHDRLTPALDLLRSLRLVSISKNAGDEEVLTTHAQIFDWVRLHVRQVYSQGEYSDFTHSWVEILAGHCLEAEHASGMLHAGRWWNLLPIINSVLEAAEFREVCSCALLDFVIVLSELIVEDRRLPGHALILINLADDLWSNMFGTALPRTLSADLYYVRMKQVQALAHILGSNISAAEDQLSHARDRVSRMNTIMSTIDPELDGKLDATEVQICFARERYQDAEEVLLRMKDKPAVSQDAIAQWHNWMAVALSRQGYRCLALQHSHRAMKFWAEEPEETRDGKIDIRLALWALKHASLLNGVRKYTAALVFLSRLFDIWSELYPCASDNLYKIASKMMQCYAELDRVSMAENLAIRILEMSPIGESGKDTGFYGLKVLHELGSIYLRHGRHVEAEGLFRFILRTFRKHNDMAIFEGFFGEKAPPSWWLDLAKALIVQGRHDEARRVCDEYRTGRHNEDFCANFLTGCERQYRQSHDLYQRAMWAAQDGMLREWCMLLRNSREAGESYAYDRAVQRFGHIQSRVQTDTPVEYETDLHFCGLARRSRVLQLLGYSLVGMSFRCKPNENDDDDDDDGNDEDDEREEEEYDDWLPPHQHLITEYFKVCRCRRHRPRSDSIEPWCLVDKRLSREGYAASAPMVPRSAQTANDAIGLEEGKGLGQCGMNPTTIRGRRLEQTFIDEYLFIMVECPFRLLSCRPDCPCRDATFRGLAEYAEQEKKVCWTSREEASLCSTSPSSSLLSSIIPECMPGPQRVIRMPALLPDEVFLRNKDEPCWYWIQAELGYGESRHENVILRHGLTIPSLSITPPDGQFELTHVRGGVDDVQPSITRYIHAASTVKRGGKGPGGCGFEGTGKHEDRADETVAGPSALDRTGDGDGDEKNDEDLDLWRIRITQVSARPIDWETKLCGFVNAGPAMTPNYE